MSWPPFLSFEGIRANTDPQGIETVSASFYVETFDEARFWIPKELAASLSPLSLRRRESQQEWGNSHLINQGKNGAYRVTFIFEGMTNPREGKMGLEFFGEGKVNSEPLGSHPELEFLIQKFEGELDPETRKLTFPLYITPGAANPGQTYFPDGAGGLSDSLRNTQLVTTGGGGREIVNPMFDVKKYFAAALTWKCVYATTRPSPDVTRRVGKIDQPPPTPDGYLPSIPDSHAWLKVIGSPQLKGNVFRVEEGWMAMNANACRDMYR